MGYWSTTVTDLSPQVSNRQFKYLMHTDICKPPPHKHSFANNFSNFGTSTSSSFVIWKFPSYNSVLNWGQTVLFPYFDRGHFNLSRIPRRSETNHRSLPYQMKCSPAECETMQIFEIAFWTLTDEGSSLSRCLTAFVTCSVKHKYTRSLRPERRPAVWSVRDRNCFVRRALRQAVHPFKCRNFTSSSTTRH